MTYREDDLAPEAETYARAYEDALNDVLAALTELVDEVSEDGGYEGQGVLLASETVQELLDSRAA